MNNAEQLSMKCEKGTCENKDIADYKRNFIERLFDREWKDEPICLCGIHGKHHKLVKMYFIN